MCIITEGTDFIDDWKVIQWKNVIALNSTKVKLVNNFIRVWQKKLVYYWEITYAKYECEQEAKNLTNQNNFQSTVRKKKST